MWEDIAALRDDTHRSFDYLTQHWGEVMLDPSVTSVGENDQEGDDEMSAFDNAHELLRQIYAVSVDAYDYWGSRTLHRVSDKNDLAWCESAMHVTNLTRSVVRCVGAGNLDIAANIAESLGLARIQGIGL